MSFWKAGIGGMIGFTIGGPIGGILGAIIGSKLSDQKQPRPTNNQQHQVAFFTALFACFAKAEYWYVTGALVVIPQLLAFYHRMGGWIQHNREYRYKMVE